MKFIKTNIYYCLLLILFIALGFHYSKQQLPETGFWAMEGTLITHYFFDELDSLSGQEIFELKNEEGISEWFSRFIFKDVCITGQCRMIRLWLFWDGAGNYLGIQMLENEPLTKSDHDEFEEADYEKLNVLLSDPNSILKNMTSEDLILEPESDNPFEADGYTGATQPTLKEVVVKDAVYSCHTLWHTVYGPTQLMIKNILRERVSSDYLKLMLESQIPANYLWVIESVENLPGYHEEFYPMILELIKSPNSHVAERAFNYFQPLKVNDSVLHKQLVNIIPELTSQQTYDIIWEFIELDEVEDVVVLTLLKLFEDQNIDVGALNLIYRLIHPNHLSNNKDIMHIIQRLSMHENAYIQNLTNRLIQRNL